MHLRSRTGCCLLAATILIGLVDAAVVQSAAAVGVSAQPAATDSGDHEVTLITGDVVRVPADRSRAVEVTRPAGREQVSFLRQSVRGHQVVIPSDAVALVNSGQLDLGLFDVTALVDYGYDGGRDLPIIVASPGAKGDLATTRSRAGAEQATVTRALPLIRGFAVKAKRARSVSYWKSLTTAGTGRRTGTRTLKPGVTRIWLDGKLKPTLDESVPQIGAPVAWAAGFDGAGVPVGIADTGIDDTHPDLVGKVLAAQDFTGEGDTLDHVGHGTHLASTIAGTGAASNGKYKGVAPATKLFSAKVCTDDGCPNSSLIAGMTWLAQTEHARVVNLSLGGKDTVGSSPLEDAVAALTAQYGTLFVIAAGNDGYSDLWSTVSSPGVADDALTVGAVNKADGPVVVDGVRFSGRGPRLGDDALKPDITAPGQDITAARSKDGYEGTPDPDNDQYVSMSGTSMATPHVAGAAAILAEQHPDWGPAQLKAGLMAAAEPNPAINVFEQGAGRVDIGRAVTQSVTTSPASLSYGRLSWPHTDDQPITRTVRYHNPGAEPLTFSLALHTTDQAGQPTPAGLFTLDRSTVTVPAGGDAAVAVTVNGRASGHDGVTGGDLTATAGDIVVQTPLGVNLEIESYDVNLVFKDRDGQPTSKYFAALAEATPTGDVTFPYDGSGTIKLRLPRSDYVLSSTILLGGAQNAYFAVPTIRVDHAQTVVLDARKAKPVSTGPAKPGFTPIDAVLGFVEPAAHGFSSALIVSNLNNQYTAQVGSARNAPGFTGHVVGRWARTDAQGSTFNTADLYALSYNAKGSFPTGFTRSLTERNTATVRGDVAEDVPGGQASLGIDGIPADGGGTVRVQFDLPRTFTAHVNTDNGVKWTFSVGQGLDTGLISTHTSDPAGYRAGHTYTTAWNRGVFGPAIPADVSRFSRTGDQFTLRGFLFADGAGRFGASAQRGSTTLERDGVAIGTLSSTSVSFAVPAASGRYRLVQDATRAAPFTTSTHNTAAWTFRSGHVGETAVAPLPLSVVRFTPSLDRHNHLAGPASVLPFKVERMAGSAAGRVRSLAVQVSYDDGLTWKNAPVQRWQDGGTVSLKAPAGSYVSVRSSLRDTAGNTYEGTIIRAFQS